MSTLPPTVVRFIETYIDRLETLEILALLRANPSKRWSSDEIRAELRSSSTASALAVDELVRSGLATREEDCVFFHPKTAALDEAAEQLLQLYRDRRTAVITAIYKRATKDENGSRDR